MLVKRILILTGLKMLESVVGVWIGPKGRALRNGISALIKSALAPLSPERRARKLNQEAGSHPFPDLLVSSSPELFMAFLLPPEGATI